MSEAIATKTDLQRIADVACPDEGDDVALGADGKHMLFGYRGFQDVPHPDCQGTGKRYYWLWRECPCKYAVSSSECWICFRVGIHIPASCVCNFTDYVLITVNVMEAALRVAEQYSFVVSFNEGTYYVSVHGQFGKGKAFQEALLSALVKALGA